MSGAPQMNGPSSPTGKKFIDTIDPDDAEYRKNLQRPAEVKEDIKQMSDRSRVSLILNSEAFRKELEEIVDEQLRQGNAPASLLALQQISNLLLPNHKFSQGAVGTGSTPVIPVSDIKGTEAMSYTKQEKVLRCKLASCYRLVDNNGWTHSIYNHITARISQDQEHFLINPFGMTYSEITASSLVKIDLRGEVIDPGATTLGVNQAGFTLHSAIHQFRPDIKCIIHLHTPSVVAVSGMKCGFLPLSQESLICGEVSYHDYNGILVDPEERESLQRNLGPINKVMILRNHGIVACGTSIEEAYHYAFNVVNACNAQIQAMPAGVDNLILVSQEIKQRTFATANQGGGGVDSSGKKWKIGEMEFEAQMRLMDNAGYRTGYSYKHPNIKRESRRERSNAEVEVPPASSSFTYVFDGDVEHSKNMSPIKAAMERQKQQYKVGWLNSPNVYVRQEMDEIGTQNPKKITKWVKDEAEDGSPKRTSTPIKVDSPNQFAPQGSDPKEFKQKQKQIKKDYYEERINAGPQSKILEGMTWEEAEKMKDGSLSATGDSVIVIGAASKGIIQRDQQHNVQVYHTQYAANPFETMSEDEIEKYKWEVEHKGGPDGLPTVQEEQLEPGPEGKLISTEERLQQVQQKVEESAPTVEFSEDGRGEGYRVNAKNNRRSARGDSVASYSDASSAASPPTSPTSPTAQVVRRAKRPTQNRPNRHSRETNVDEILAYSDKYAEHRKSRETCIDDIITEHDLSGDSNIDDILPNNRYSRISNVDSIDDLHSSEASSPAAAQSNFQRSESARYPPKSPELIDELKAKNFDRSKSERKVKNKKEKAMNGDDDQMRSPAKSDTLRSTDSASGGETLEERSSKEGSPTKEHPSPTKEKKKKKKFRMPSFSKTKKSKESKESSI
ncbi:alpha-adducin-like isoform X5 [Ruditapes philippinarum]|uniref:alpha-adducin-like isoform X5 n=1 Tax=Ruditapes philippinarum TaxID=129788 RepID=UPI00295B177F|nr:alpha-adducin-like isoform X5 [Ruditapes philippinarum]